MGLRATWASGRCPCPWSLSSLPTPIIPWFYVFFNSNLPLATECFVSAAAQQHQWSEKTILTHNFSEKIHLSHLGATFCHHKPPGLILLLLPPGCIKSSDVLSSVASAAQRRGHSTLLWVLPGCTHLSSVPNSREGMLLDSPNQKCLLMSGGEWSEPGWNVWTFVLTLLWDAKSCFLTSGDIIGDFRRGKTWVLGRRLVECVLKKLCNLMETFFLYFGGYEGETTSAVTPP